MGPRRAAQIGEGTLALAIDAVSVVAFVVAGRASHRRGDGAGGAASTAWPFLAGLAAGWSVLAAGRASGRAGGAAGTAGSPRSPLSLPAGALVCAHTVAVGMGLRARAGKGTPPLFVGISTGFLGASMLGGRAAARMLVRRAGPRVRQG